MENGAGEKEKEVENELDAIERSEDEQETVNDEVKGKKEDGEKVTKDGQNENIKLHMDDGGPDGSSMHEELLVSDTEDISPREHSINDVCKTQVQEVPADDGNENCNKNKTEEEPNRVKTAGENDADCEVAAGMSTSSLNYSVTVDKKTPMKTRGESIQEGLQKISSRHFVSEKSSLDNVSHAGTSARGFETVMGGLILEEDEKEAPVMMEISDPNFAYGFDSDSLEGGESGTEDEQSSFMKELEKFFKEASLEFKPPKFYGEPLNLLKLWRAVIKLGGYDKVTACKLWRQVGESFRPPKTCTTVSWTFRIFYEKALLDYEKHRSRGGELNIPPSQAGPGSIETQTGNSQAPGSGRARRDAAARAMQGWHSQRLLSNGEVGDPIIKEKSSAVSMKIREKHLKNIGVQKRKWPLTPEVLPSKAAVRPKVIKTQSDSTAIIDIGPPADWVKINVKTTKDCYEVYALVPGLLREEVRVQTDPAGRLVITGDPEHADNPWGVTPFKKIVSLPSRIDPHQTSAVVTLHGQLFVRVPFEQLE